MEKQNQPVNEYHIPILLKESVEALNIKPDGVYVDCTFGGGGHSSAILQQLNDNGKLIAFDQDKDAERNLPPDKRLIFVHQNFRHLTRFLRLHKISQVDGIIADLGISSYQINKAERGFSTRFDAKLDMRMDQRQSTNAAELVNNSDEQQLHKIFEQYGEITNSKTLAKTIITQRMLSPIQTINDFKQAVEKVVKGNPKKYFAQVFQALRIAVNEELEALKELLQQIPSVVKSQGRIVIITFHSLEDRLVKNFFKNGTFIQKKIDEVYGSHFENPLQIITKKPLTASEEEIKKNPRSRSAKLRVAEKK